MSKYLCKKCKEWTEEIDFDFEKMMCDECSKVIKICQNCGAENTTKFCDSCGLCTNCN